jgi:hypothetical protein
MTFDEWSAAVIALGKIKIIIQRHISENGYDEMDALNDIGEIVFPDVSGQENVGTFSGEPPAANLAGPESDARAELCTHDSTYICSVCAWRNIESDAGAKMNQRLELIEDRIEISKRFGTNDVPDDGNECAHCGGRTDENGMCLGER